MTDLEPSRENEVLGFFIITIQHTHALYIEKFGTLAGLGSNPQAQMTMSPVKKHSWCWDLPKEPLHVQFW
jgi:hypothetical protein